MCGLFGWIGTSCDLAALRRAAELAAKRGPDICGILSDGHKWTGPTDKLPVLNPARIVIGHFRLATDILRGTPEAQPVARNGIVLAHNGSVANYGAMVSRYQPELTTRIDSELILWILERLSGPLDQRLRRAAQVLDLGPAWAMAIFDGSKLLLANYGLNLYVREDGQGIYWCSLQPDDGWEALEGIKKKACLKPPATVKQAF
jgi:asparagine synthetase B (glutamine-hydrolysing)